jgi:hypothetical protein
MSSQFVVLVQVPRGGALDRSLAANPPPSVIDGQVVIEHLPAGPAAGSGAPGLGPPRAGEIVLSVLSPEALARDPQEVERVIGGAGQGDQPLVIIVDAAEELREDELVVVVDAAARAAPRPVILRVLADA